MNPLAQAFIFDVEGTLIECVALVLQCWQRTLASHGFAFSVEELHQYSGMDGKLMLATLVPRLSPSARKLLLDEQGERYRKDYIQQARALPDVDRLFDWLSRNGRQTALATTSQPDELRHYLKLLRITDKVTATVCGDEVSKEKPASDLIDVALKKLPAPHGEVIVVGDSPYDAQAAQEAGAIAFGVLTGGFSADELQKAGCKEIASDPANLLRILVRQGTTA
ncbi:MAG: HAD family hydrolase [Pseudorhodoplanes sp.]|uniref:HAD family hydrolase n=1 Tax=Pseudorhodoplanes sp. TaxID=1934341 RepID=UPI003D149DBA